ncbi:RloB family protein [Tautonia sociabilis]|uniref:RloB domain-containing protein n=1 Tax=Tautonia sociabilis TaxID=2080755 RepID=A0A432MMY3_9BACT|nr:RloB family protein [Tautonia sociabilis]RUL88660.1 RloB domain-containing protein [Tautonia sociabilis]
MSFGPDRRRRPGRRPPTRSPKRKILIVCEGAKTEPQYFKQFASVHRAAIVQVDVIPGSGVPLTVVQEAKRRKAKASEDARRENDPYLKYDLVWCVFDVDDHPHLKEALQTAERNGIDVALSNPCFELWLMLHLRDAPGSIHRRKAQAMMKRLVANYDKSVDFDVYRDGYASAVARARKLDELAEADGEPGRNPTTNVYVLTEMIANPPGGLSV